MRAPSCPQPHNASPFITAEVYPAVSSSVKMTDFRMEFGMLYPWRLHMTTHSVAQCVLMSRLPQREDTPVVKNCASCGELRPKEEKYFHPPTLKMVLMRFVSCISMNHLLPNYSASYFSLTSCLLFCPKHI